LIDAASKSQLNLAKKAEEFPNDKTTTNALGAAETRIRLMRDELLVMATSTEVSVREAQAITGLATSARNKEAYNRLYAKTLPIARSGNTAKFNLYF
jgi:hypothetical protein